MIERATAAALISRAGTWLEDGRLRAGWSRATDTAIVLGSGQQDLPETDLPVVRRGTGGGAVVCGPGYLMLDVVLPSTHPLVLDDVTEAYRWLSEWLIGELAVDGLRALAPSAVHKQSDEDRAAARLACFAGFGPYELVTADGRKLVGLAQRRRRQAVLYQAAAYTEAPLHDLAALLGQPWIAGRLAAIATLAEVAPRFAADPPLPTL